MISNTANIILIDDEAGTRKTLCGILEDAGYSIIGLEKGIDAMEKIREAPFDAVITDIRLPDVDGMEILELAKETNPDAAVIMMTGYASMETAVDAVNEGAYAYFIKPVNPDELKTTIANALKQQRLSMENKRLLKNLQSTNNILLEVNEELRNEVVERKQAEEALRQSEQRFRDVAENSLEWIWEVDANGKYIYVSPLVTRILGYEIEEMLNKHFYDLFHPEDKQQLKRAAFQAFARKEPFHEFINQNIRKNGEIVWLSTSGVPIIDEKGDLVGYRGADTDITERIQAEKLYSTLAKSSPVGVYIVQDGKFRFVNPQFQMRTGYSEDELLNMAPLELIHHEDREKTRENAVRMLKGKPISPYEFRVINKNGETHWAMETVTSINYKGKRATLGNFMDITESKRVEEELRLRAQLLDNASDSISVLDPDGNILYINEIFCSSHGYSREELIGMNIRQLDIPLFDEFLESLVQELEEKGTAVFETTHLRKDGSTIVVEVHSRVFESDNSNILLSVERDITERKQMEQELQEKNEQLDAQNEELQSQAEELLSQRQELIEKAREVERANQLKSEFLANMSHELRTPLNVIIGFSELMADEVPGKINEEQRECLSDILTSSRHLLNLINGVLDLSKIESGKVEFNLENVDLNKVIESFTRTVMPILKPRKQKLDVEIEDRLPLVYADEGKLSQVLLNLVDNASKFSPNGSRLKVRAATECNLCQVSVIDNGTGIKKEDQERIFEPFSRLDNPLTKERGGTGLGLALVKQIVERYGGQIWIESECGKGSQFTFTLPLATSDANSLERSRR